MTIRVRLDVTGVVQGVGFRPTVARIAVEHGISGFVYNDAGAVHCEFEGAATDVDAAVAAIRTCPPPMARVDNVAMARLQPLGETQFDIVVSRDVHAGRTLVPPDVAICADCLRELRDPADRRYGHPFITCTNCGPRYTVITDLPYDRPTTTMAQFPMCAACAAEYRDPADRRFHAQTIACGDCGPSLTWMGPGGEADPLGGAAQALADGLIVAVKGIGGFHLACRADDPHAVATLRRRKQRPAKPFAVMAADLAMAQRIAEVGEDAAAQLRSPAAPIVVLPGRSGVVDAVAPGLRDVGVMLAYSPLHHLLFDRLGPIPLVMTSANQGGSPIVYRDADLDLIIGSPAGPGTAAVADCVLTHDRPIHVPCEDSVVSVDAHGGAIPIRRSRGYAPLPVTLADVRSKSVILATGGDLKTTFCLMSGDGHAHMSAHLGDMADPRTQGCFESAYQHLADMVDRRPDLIVCDLHPSYATTRWARRQQHPVVQVQHHHAHAVSLLAEHGRLGTPIIAVAYDGTGYGTDGTIWGGELLAVTDPAQFTRIGHLKPFALPGGDHAARRPARIALDLLYRAGIEWDAALPCVAAVGAAGVHILRQQIPRSVGCVSTTSMGRLFDAVASLLGVCQTVSYEGQAAVELEQLARGGRVVPLEFALDPRSPGILDPAPIVAGLVDGMRGGLDTADLAAGFHQAVIEATAVVVADCAQTIGIGTIGLTGGVFVNRLLLEGLRKALLRSGFEVLTHAVLPCNDGGLALGQAVIAAATRGRAEGSSACA